MPWAEAAYLRAPAAIAGRLYLVFRYLENDPEPDGVAKTWIPRPPLALAVIAMEGMRVIYSFGRPSEQVIYVHAFGLGDDPIPGWETARERR